MGAPFDINELRRRLLLSPQTQNLSELEEYKKALTQAPTRQPVSRARNILGDIAGALYGTVTRSPAAGMALGHNIHEQPFQRAQQRFGEQVAPIAQRADIALQQAKATDEARKAMGAQYGDILKGEADYSKSTPEYQQRQVGYKPKSLQELQAVEQSKIRPNAPHYFTDALTGDIKEVDPVTRDIKVVSPHAAQTIKEKQGFEKEKLGIQHGNRLSEIAAREKAIKERSDAKLKTTSKGQKQVTPLQEQMVYEDMYANKPEYKAFLKQSTSGHYRVIPPSNIQDKQYQAFLAERASALTDLQQKLNRGVEPEEEESDWEEQ